MFIGFSPGLWANSLRWVVSAFGHRLSLLQLRKFPALLIAVCEKEDTFSSLCERKSSVVEGALKELPRSAEYTLNCPELNEPLAYYVSLLRSFATAQALPFGRQVHQFTITSGLQGNGFLGSLLVQMYGRCGDIESAHACFVSMRERNVLSWNYLIGAYARLGCSKEVFRLFEQMQLEATIPDNATFVIILSICASQPALVEGMRIHVRILLIEVVSAVVVATSVVNMYAKCNSLGHARETFDKMFERDVISWNAVIAAHAQQGHGKEALKLFGQLQQEAVAPDHASFVSILCACVGAPSLNQGKRIHACIQCSPFEKEIVVITALLNMYCKCNSLADARRLFDNIPERNVVSWSALIAGYSQNGLGKEALILFHRMQEEGVAVHKVTCVSVLDACCKEAALKEGQTIHTFIMYNAFESDVIVGTAILNMYSKCGSIEDARRVFDLMPEQNVVSWNTIISGYAQHGHSKEAFELFDEMQQKEVMADKLTVIGVLSACVCHAALTKGNNMHMYTIHNGLESHVTVANAILNMYRKCGNLDDARKIFGKMLRRSLVSWNCMIASYAQHSYDKEALKLFFQMLQGAITPNDVTFISVLSACSHAGLVDEGFSCMVFMIQNQGIQLSADHFDCMIDLLGRAGRLDYAEYLINTMPVQPSVVSWATLLGACRNSIDGTRGDQSARYLSELDLTGATPYIMWWNIHAVASL